MLVCLKKAKYIIVTDILKDNIHIGCIEKVRVRVHVIAVRYTNPFMYIKCTVLPNLIQNK